MESLIWWLDEAQKAAAGEPLLTWPAYIQREFASLLGRAGRGRLWVDTAFGDVFVTWPEERTPLTRYLERCGGIVIRRDDVEHVRGLPGTITTMTLEVWRG